MNGVGILLVGRLYIEDFKGWELEESKLKGKKRITFKMECVASL